jgi:hypothetical protein
MMMMNNIYLAAMKLRLYSFMGQKVYVGFYLLLLPYYSASYF